MNTSHRYWSLINYSKDESTVKYDIEVCTIFKTRTHIIKIISYVRSLRWNLIKLVYYNLYRGKVLQRENVNLASTQGNRLETLPHHEQKHLLIFHGRFVPRTVIAVICFNDILNYEWVWYSHYCKNLLSYIVSRIWRLWSISFCPSKLRQNRWISWATTYTMYLRIIK